MKAPSESASRASRLRQRAAVWIVAGLLLAVIGLPIVEFGIVDAQTPGLIGFAKPFGNKTANATVALNLTDAPSFVPRFPAVNISTNLTIHLDNRGKFNHTFTLLKQPNVVLNRSWGPNQLNAYFNGNGSWENVSLPAGATASVDLTINASVSLDSFEFVSVVPYQFQAGMYGFLNVTGGAGLYLSDNATNALTFVPDVLQANVTHFPVVFNVQVFNLGSFGHTWSLASQSNVTLSPSNYTTYFTSHPPLASPAVPGTPGQFAWANFSLTSGGVYEFICQVSGHFAAGMFGYLYVNVAPPAPPVAPSTAIIQGAVLVGSAALVGIGVVLVAIASYTGRFPPRSNDGHHHY